MEGWVPITFCDGLPDTPDTLRPAAVIAVVACCTVSWITLGTVVVGGPVETFTVTVDPKGACAPLAGDVEISWPFGTVALDSLFWVAASPTACSAAWACEKE